MFRKDGKGSLLGSSSRISNSQDVGILERLFHVQVEEKSRIKPKSNKKSKRVQLKIDVTLLLVVITLLIFGLVMVYSASYDYSLSWYKNPTTIFYRQIALMGLGLVIAITLTLLDYRIWKQFAIIAMGFTVLLLIGVLFVNEVRNGAVRTLWGGSIQPSELAKIVTIIYLAVWLSAKRENLSDISIGLIPLAIILGLFGGLILIQPDFSAVITILLLGGLMFFLAGGDLKQIFLLMVIALLVGWAIVQLSPTGSERIDYFVAGLKDPSQGSYHVRRSLEAIIKGGWFGAGIGKAETKLTGLPVPPTDSIFAVVGEETGVIGAAFVVCLFTVLMWRGLVIARHAPDQLGSLLAAGLTLWLAIEAFINMAVMVNLLPFAGNALPFISAGGSNLIVSMAAVGILLNISRLSVQRKEDQGKVFDAVVDLRRRDRRRRVSSARRPAGRKS
jgi:cell division protein FtsW